MATTHKKNVLDVESKLRIIESKEKDNLNMKEITEKFNIGKTQFYEILKKKDEIINLWLHGSGSSKRKKRTTGNEQINEFVWRWYVDAKSRNLPISGPILQGQAKDIALDLGKLDFHASNGWLESFRKRHGIKFKEACSENLNIYEASGSASKEETDHIPLEPTVEIKVEPTDYEPTPSTSKDSTSEEFILPHEDHSWTTPNPGVEPQLTLSVSDPGSRNKPETNDHEQPNKKWKSESTVPSTNGPTTNPVYNFSGPGSSKERHKDQFDVFGEYIAAKLRNLDRISCAFAQKAIGDIIFEAEMGKYLNQSQNTNPVSQ